MQLKLNICKENYFENLKRHLYTDLKEIQKQRLEKLTKDLENSILIEDSKLDPEIVPYMSKEELVARERRIRYRKQLLEDLKSSDVTGRLVINLSEKINEIVEKGGRLIVSPVEGFEGRQIAFVLLNMKKTNLNLVELVQR